MMHPLFAVSAMTKICFLFVSLCWITACSAPSEHKTKFNKLLNSENPALHAVHDREVRELMDRVNGVMMERFMSEHEMDIERRKYANKIIQAANNLSLTAKTLVEKIPNLNLNPEEQTAFHNLADKLNLYALTLQKQAEEHNYNAIPSTLHEVSSICMACHTLFRQL